jgi:glycine betaine/proline transport system substrate-binding protein
MGVWYEPATLELTVPTYVDEVDSLADLAENADLFGGEIVGIEAGAGMMGLLSNEVMPTYGLDENFTLLESSTAAMRAELQRAYEAQEPIVVTLWTPHPEYGLKDLKRLEDPEGAWGTPERLHAIARDGFEDDFPQVAEWIRNFEMTQEQLDELNGAVEEAADGEERQAAREWIDNNRDVVDGWLGR